MDEDQEALGTWEVRSQFPQGPERRELFAGITESMVATEVRERQKMSKFYGSDQNHTFRRIA